VEGRKARQQRLEILHNRRKEDVQEMLTEKKYLTQLMMEEQTREIQLKQQRAEQVKRMEEEMKLKKEQEKQEREKRKKEEYEKKMKEEMMEAERAQKLVKMLEKKEKEWIEKLKSTQTMQDTAFEQLETALSTAVPRLSSHSRVSVSQNGSDTLETPLPTSTTHRARPFSANRHNSLKKEKKGLASSSSKPPLSTQLHLERNCPATNLSPSDMDRDHHDYYNNNNDNNDNDRNNSSPANNRLIVDHYNDENDSDQVVRKSNVVMVERVLPPEATQQWKKNDKNTKLKPLNGMPGNSLMKGKT
jgi:DNA polymerase III alpha subunit (gram-positive type)